ncbi:MAG: phosphoribosyltransferase [Methanoregula sp.]|jgi:hypothetical protein
MVTLGVPPDVFKSPKMNYSTSYYQVEYHPKNLPHSDSSNPDHDINSANLLALKDRFGNGYYGYKGKSISQKEGMDFFFNLINPLINLDVPVLIIPSSNPEKTRSGMLRFAQKLASAGRIDATDCIVRTKKVDQDFSKDEDNEIEYKSSLEIKNLEKIRGKKILLLDDVRTTGNSFQWVKEMLLENGAKEVGCLALGQTKR